MSKMFQVSLKKCCEPFQVILKISERFNVRIYIRERFGVVYFVSMYITILQLQYYNFPIHVLNKTSLSVFIYCYIVYY